MPAYEILLGGSYGGSIEGTRFGQRLAGMKVPAREAPQFLRDALTFYKEKRREGEEFNQFIDRVGVKAFEPLAAKYHEVPALGPKTINLYFDWDKTVLFKVERGEGECSV